MSNSILLHKEKGINPHMTICSRCGGDGEEILLLGTSDTKFYCSGCSQNVIAPARTNKCPNCRRYDTLDLIGTIDDWEKITTGICSKCEKELKEHKKVVSEGGIYFRCKCGAEGVIKPSNKICKDVRDKMNIQAPKPCGVELPSCPACEDKNG